MTTVIQGRSPANDRDLPRGGCGQVRRQPHVGGREALVQAGVQHCGRGPRGERRTADPLAPAPPRPPPSGFRHLLWQPLWKTVRLLHTGLLAGITRGGAVYDFAA